MAGLSQKPFTKNDLSLRQTNASLIAALTCLKSACVCVCVCVCLGSQDDLLLHLQTSNFTPLDRVSILSEALPYLQQFRGKTVVVKYGGAAMKDPKLKVCLSVCSII